MNPFFFLIVNVSKSKFERANYVLLKCINLGYFYLTNDFMKIKYSYNIGSRIYL